MKTVSIRELHASTGKLVRASQQEPLIITEHGRRVAVLKPFTPGEVAGVPFPRRSLAKLPRVRADSTALIAEDRGGR